MISYLIDINVWVAMTWSQHPQHKSAYRWYGSIDDAELLFCRLTMLGFLRLLTNESVMGASVTTLGGAVELYDRWMQDPRVELVSEPRQIEPLFREALGHVRTQRATKAVADCYLVALAEATGARLVTLDKALAATARIRSVGCTLLETGRK